MPRLTRRHDQGAECKRLVDAAVDRWGRLIPRQQHRHRQPRQCRDEKPDEYRRVMQVNVETMFWSPSTQSRP